MKGEWCDYEKDICNKRNLSIMGWWNWWGSWKNITLCVFRWKSSKSMYNRFVVTGDEYYTSDYADKYRVIYDKNTNIVYLCKCGDGYRGAMSVMYNSQGQPMTLEEYQSSK